MHKSVSRFQRPEGNGVKSSLPNTSIGNRDRPKPGFVVENPEGGSVRICMTPRHRIGHAIFFAVVAAFCAFWVMFGILYPNGIEYVDGRQTAGYNPNMHDFLAWSPIFAAVSLGGIAALRYALWMANGKEDWGVSTNELIVMKSLLGFVRRKRFTNSIIEVDHKPNNDADNPSVEGYTGYIHLHPVGASKWKYKTIYRGTDVDDIQALARVLSNITGWPKEPIARLWRRKS